MPGCCLSSTRPQEVMEARNLPQGTASPDETISLDLNLNLNQSKKLSPYIHVFPIYLSYLERMGFLTAQGMLIRNGKLINAFSWCYTVANKSHNYSPERKKYSPATNNQVDLTAKVVTPGETCLFFLIRLALVWSENFQFQLGVFKKDSWWLLENKPRLLTSLQAIFLKKPPVSI